MIHLTTSRFSAAMRQWLPLLFIALYAVSAAAQEETPKVDALSSPAAVEQPKSEEKHDHVHGHAGAGAASLGKQLPLWTVIPFVTLLLCIAILPLANPHWWEHNSNKGIIAGGLALLIAAYLSSYGHDGIHALQHIVLEYATFIILLGALYVISGGVYVSGSLDGTPTANTLMLALGALIASIVGTTGASVLLIRPLLRANRKRVAKAHIVVFFIFIVSNCGGLLTPLGDPPLFMGFTSGVPFEWTLFNLWKQWAFVNVILLVLFMFWDSHVFQREERAREGSQLEEVMKHEPIGVSGALNFLFLGGVILAVLGKGHYQEKWPWGVQEGIMLAMTVLAYLTTSRANREANKFTFGPIIEVAVLFIGIFITMTPALQILNAWGAGNRPDLGKLALESPAQFFWVSGILSSFLDNAPTYITMAATAAGMNGITAEGAYLREFIGTANGPSLLAAISCGAVFMGANTYIGNGPNFMVKAIAEENDVKMPSFFGYMAFSGMILIPIFIAVTFVFFRG